MINIDIQDPIVADAPPGNHHNNPSNGKGSDKGASRSNHLRLVTINNEFDTDMNVDLELTQNTDRGVNILKSSDTIQPQDSEKFKVNVNSNKRPENIEVKIDIKTEDGKIESILYRTTSIQYKQSNNGEEDDGEDDEEDDEEDDGEDDEEDSECPEWVNDYVEENGKLKLTGKDYVECDIKDDLEVNTQDVGVDVYSKSVLDGNIDTDGDVNVKSKSEVTGNIKSSSNDIQITGKSTVGGDVVAPKGINIDIDGDSTIEGSVVAKGDGSLSLSGATIDGDVYVNKNDLSCSGMKIGSDKESCSEYQFKDPSDYGN